MIRLLPGFAIAFLLLSSPLQADQYARYADNVVTLDNGVVARTIRVDPEQHGFLSQTLKLTTTPFNYLVPGGLEFRFALDGQTYSGEQGWRFVEFRPIEEPRGGNGTTVVLDGANDANKHLRLHVTYMLYPDLPVIRKRIAFENRGDRERMLEALDVEHLHMPESHVNAWTLRNYARQHHLGTYVGDWFDPAIIVYHTRIRKGLVLGNEAPGVIKRTTTFLNSRKAITIGLTHPDDEYPSRKWLAPGETWTSPWTFIAPFENEDDPYRVIDDQINTFVRRHMGIRLYDTDHLPTLSYNTWTGFYHDISDEKVRAAARAAAACGAQEFHIDDGWQENYGDWQVDREKFPNGLKPVCDYIRSLGMKPGIWISAGAAETSSRIYNAHPDWFIKDENQRNTNLHIDPDLGDFDKYHSACFATGWRDYITSVIIDLIKDNGFEYVKIDFAVVTSAYRLNKAHAGCYAKNHPLHRDHNESLVVLYERVWSMFDEIYAACPDVYIDCTFETMGKMHLIDYAMCKHAHGNWLANITQKTPLGGLRVRNLAWRRTPMVPAASMVIGNPPIEDPGGLLAYLSQLGTYPIMLGDVREVTAENAKRYRAWSHWTQAVERRHRFMHYRQDLPGFGEPSEGHWDGFLRINTDTQSGGLVGVFRQGASENQRTVFVTGLAPDKTYQISRGPDGETIGRFSGTQLRSVGFPVTFDEKHAGAVFEVSSLD